MAVSFLVGSHWSWPSFASVFLGAAEAAFRHVAEGLPKRRNEGLGQSLAELPGVQQAVGEMRMRLDAARATLLAAVARPPDPDPVAHYGRMAGAKLFCCQTALEVCTLALRTAGGSGYLRTGPLERLLRDAHAGLLLPPSHDATLQWLGRVELVGTRPRPARWSPVRAPALTIDRTRPVPPARCSIDNEYYEGMDELWWDPAGPAAILHAINRPRVGFYLEQLGDLGGRLVLDAGCGGGLVARELAAAGAEVVGVDRSLGSLGVARRAVRGHFRPAQGRLERLPFADGSFDAVVAADVLEHLPDLPAAVDELARVLAPGGSFVFDTVNRTPWSWFTAVFGLEQVLRMVPRGTHDWRLFIRPAELDRLLRGAGLAPVELTGLAPQIGPGVVARGLLTRRIDVPSFATGNGRRASYLGHYRKASA